MGLFEFLFPKQCFGCGMPGQYFCQNCLIQAGRVNQICPVCKKFSLFGETHTRCKKRDLLDGLISFFAYEGIIREAIHKLKYKFVTDLVDELTQLVLEELMKRKEEFLALENFLRKKMPVVVPVPLHWYKENTRGFNQAGLIGQRLARKWGLDFKERLLKRKKYTLSQTKLTEKERQQNIKDVFSLSSAHTPSPHILLIDDVWTTGATMNEAARVLKKSGAKIVWGLTIAR